MKKYSTITSANTESAPKWIHWTDDYKDYASCSECDFGEEGELLLKDITPYCPWCGAKMSNYDPSWRR